MYSNFSNYKDYTLEEKSTFAKKVNVLETSKASLIYEH